MSASPKTLVLVDGSSYLYRAFFAGGETMSTTLPDGTVQKTGAIRILINMVQALRKEDLFKSPGVAETVDWASALTELDVVALDPATVSDTLGVLLKYQDDIARLDGTKVKALLDEVKSELRAAE